MMRGRYQPWLQNCLILSVKAFSRSLALWASLAGISWLLVQPNSPQTIGIYYGLIRLFSLAVAAVLTWFAVAALPTGRGWRWSFWMVTSTGWLTVSLLLQGRFENRIHEDDRQIHVLGMACAVGAVGWLMWRGKRLPRWTVLGDMAAGCVAVGLLGGIAFWKYSADTAAARERAVARWSEIGMPLSDVEQSLVPQQETAGSQECVRLFAIFLANVSTRKAPPPLRVSPSLRSLKKLGT